MQRHELSALTSLRGIAAVWVFSYHALALTKDLAPQASLPLRLIASGGYLGVDLFFVLSGFVIAYNYAESSTHRSWRAYSSFLWKRLARIYPGHLAALGLFAAGLLIYDTHFDLSFVGLLRSLTLTQAWSFPGEQIWNPVAWSISCEWAAYLLFPIIALGVNRVSARVAVGCVIVTFAALFVAYKLGPWGGGPHSLGLQRVAACFTAGVLTHRIWQFHNRPMNALTLVAALLLIIGASVIDTLVFRGYSAPRAVGLASLVVYGLACCDGWLAKRHPRFEYIGRISYSLYLVHWVVLTITQTFLEDFGLTKDVAAVYAGIVFGLIFSGALAHFFYSCIEEPGRRWMLARHKPASNTEMIRTEGVT